jgi:hypothetical protein
MFEFLNAAGRWEPLGTGDGRGKFALRKALHDLAALCDEEMPRGYYRYLPASRDADYRWRYFVLSKSGSILKSTSPRP